jgi:spermidine/putrescine-binding protein
MIAIGCSGPKSGTPGAQATKPDDNVVNLYTWADYIAPGVLESFEKLLTGVKVRVAIFETNETLETLMLTGHSGHRRDFREPQQSLRIQCRIETLF